MAAWLAGEVAGVGPTAHGGSVYSDIPCKRCFAASIKARTFG